MRAAVVVLATLSAPAQAWEFSPTPVCTLSHAQDGAEVEVTFDPTLPEPYAISITLPTAWTDAPVFSIRYEGGRALTISTSRHLLSEDGRTLTVTDSGFGNVLDGIEFNDTATAMLGDAEVPLSLDGADGPVSDFRACESAAVA